MEAKAYGAGKIRIESFTDLEGRGYGFRAEA